MKILIWTFAFLLGIVFGAETVVVESEAQIIERIAIASWNWNSVQRVYFFNESVRSNHLQVCRFLLEHVIGDFDVTFKEALVAEEAYLSSPYDCLYEKHIDLIPPFLQLFNEFGLDAENIYGPKKFRAIFTLLVEAFEAGRFHEFASYLSFDRFHLFESFFQMIFTSDKDYRPFAAHLISIGVTFSGYRDEWGRNALMTALEYDDEEFAKVLIPLTPDLNATDSYGRTALDIIVARRSGSEVELAILAAGGQRGNSS